VPTDSVVTGVQGSSFDAPAKPVPPPLTKVAEASPPVPLATEPKDTGKCADLPVPKSVPDLTLAHLTAAVPSAGTPTEKAIEATPVATLRAPEKPVVPPAENTAKAAVPAPVIGVPGEPKLVEKPAAVDEKPLSLSFAKLYFRYWPQVKGGRNPFPTEVQALDGKKVTIDGYMIPIDFEKGKVRSFLLSRSMMGCCYADSPQITEMIKVVPADGKMVSFQALARVTGILEVGEEKDSEGYVESVYRIKADIVGVSPPGKW
jgi:hypothetical protein